MQEPEPEPVREVPVRLEPVFDKVIEKVEQMDAQAVMEEMLRRKAKR